MADKLPLKLKDLGSGQGALSEFEPGDQIPQALINGLVDALAGKLATGGTAFNSARLGNALASTFMQFGDAGIGKNSTPSLADLNAAAITGINSYGAAAANKPPSTATSTGGVVLTAYFNNTNAVQWATPYGASELWVRTMAFGAWGTTWTRELNTADAQTSSTDAGAGKLLKVGAFGLGAPINLTSPDLSQARAPGFYYCNSPTNGPGGNGYLSVQGADGAYQVHYFESAIERRQSSRQIVAGVASPWLPVYSAANILGTVSQIGGVPTGAIIQSGSSANGRVVRYADGTQICWNTITGNRTVPAMEGFSLTPSLAASFVGVPVLSTSGIFFESPDQLGSVLYATIADYTGPGAVMVNTGQRAANFLPSFTPGATTAQSYEWSFLAVGRWF